MRTAASFITAFIVVLAACAYARTFHVAKNGNDKAAGDQVNPYLTINHATQVAQPGDSIIVHEGAYREWVQPARGGSSEATRITRPRQATSAVAPAALSSPLKGRV